MNRFLFIFFFYFSLSCFSQHVEVLERMHTTNLSVQKDFEYLSFKDNTDALISVATIRASGKKNIAELFAAIQEEANSLGANCFKMIQYINDDATGGQSSLTLETFFAQSSFFIENEKPEESNMIYIFGKDRKGTGKTSFKLNDAKCEVRDRHFFRYENDVYQRVKISKGGFIGVSLSIIGETNFPPVYLTLSGLGVAPAVVFERYVGAGLGYGAGGMALSLSTGSIKSMNPNLARLLIEVWKPEANTETIKKQDLSKSQFKKLLKGKWKGDAVQYDINESWDIELQYDARLENFIVNYPTLDCSGSWTVREMRENTLTLEELISKDTENQCIAKGIVVLEFVNDKTFNFFYYLTDSSQLIAKGIIKR